MTDPTPPNPTVGIEFYNEQATKLILCIETACIEVVLEPDTEYRVESDETEYRIEFREKELVVLYLAYRLGPKVFTRPYSKDFENLPAWELILDYSDM